MSSSSANPPRRNANRKGRKRSRSVMFYATEDERSAIVAGAEAAGLTLAEFLIQAATTHTRRKVNNGTRAKNRRRCGSHAR